MSFASVQLRRLQLYFRLSIAGLIGFILCFFWYVQTERAIDIAYEQRQQSFLLADELRQSSDDLTRMVRSYVLTGEQRYKQHFVEIMAIRDGEKPRPELYQRIYWDLVLADDQRPRPAKTSIPLLSLMKNAGFTQNELNKLNEAKKYSDDLTRIEFAAMQLFEQSQQLPTAQALSLQLKAGQMLFDTAYHQAKAGIMRPIDEFYSLIEKRTADELQHAIFVADITRLFFVLSGIGLIGLFWQIRFYFQAVLGTSLPQLYLYISRLGAQGPATQELIGTKQQDTILGWLAKTAERLKETELKRQKVQVQLEYQAHYDELTGLANRKLLIYKLEQAIQNQPGQKIAILYLDLDGFQALNEYCGYEIGNQLLQLVTHRLQSCLKPEDLLARCGGDEFVILLSHLLHEQHGVQFAHTLLQTLSNPFQLGAMQIPLTASLGVTFYPQSRPIEAEQLLRQADQAMYQAKQSGKNRYYCFDAAQDEKLRGYHQQIEQIRQGLLRDEFELYYQPKVNMQTGECKGVEALIRWHHPTQGLLTPGHFLPATEQHPVGILIGRWVLQRAIADFQRLPCQMQVSVNIAANHLQYPDFVKDLSALLQKVAHQAPFLELEILESSALDDTQNATAVMRACQKMGIRFALDDFGTGYSSLSYLKQLPIHVIKVDQSFVRDVLADDEDLPILQGILALANAFALEVIAEGVETEAHGAKLLQLGYTLGQGYAIAKPMPLQALRQWQTQWQPPPSWRDDPSENRIFSARD